ncbi:hypothetical protein [Xenorhabdus bharatensis]|uniref:hypothetical protein n=1 Tax=Xenorhabdus bharatensis TaxID=3136256 RepID=UPI0030F42375
MKKSTLTADGVIDSVTIVRLETELGGSANNNARVTFKDKNGKVNSNYLLAYPNYQIEGVGVYNTLLIALSQSMEVSLKITSYVNDDGDGYISGVIFDAS